MDWRAFFINTKFTPLTVTRCDECHCLSDIEIDKGLFPHEWESLLQKLNSFRLFYRKTNAPPNQICLDAV